jgi:hypothetical protein
MVLVYRKIRQIHQRHNTNRFRNSDKNLQQIALLLNTRRDVPAERLYRVLGFTHVPPKPKICSTYRRRDVPMERLYSYL